MNIKKYTQKDRYGNSMTFEFDVPPLDGGGAPPHPGQAVGTDTVPAMLTPGEFVMNAEATRMFQPQIEAMNEQGRAVQRQQGGSIPSNVPPTPARQTVQHRNAGGHITGGGHGIPGMVGGLPTMDPMVGARMPNNQTAMDNMMVPPVPQVAPQFFNEGGQVRKTGFASFIDALGFGSMLPENQTPVQQQQRKLPVDTSAPDNALGGVATPKNVAPQQVNSPQRTVSSRDVPVDLNKDMNNPQARTQRTQANAQLPQDLEASIGARLDAQGEQQIPEGEVIGTLGAADKETFLKKTIQETNADAQADNQRLYSGRGDKGMENYNENRRIAMGEQAKKKDPSAFDKIFNTLKGAAGELFDEGELGRAALLYLGNRALGFSHGGSLNWTAKQYLQRVDSKAAAHSKRVQGLLDSGEYTKSSVAKYQKTKDINDLVEVGLTYTPTGKTEFRMIPTQGEDGKWSMKREQLREVKGSDGGIYFQNARGERIDPLMTMPHQPENDPSMPEYGAKNQRVAEYLKGTMESKLKLLDSEKGFGGKDQPNRPIGFTADEASKQFVAFARDLGLDPDSEYVQNMASNALAQAYGDAAKGTKATVYTPYLTQQFIREETGTKDHLKTGEDGAGRPTYVRADLIAKVNAQMVAAANQRRKKAGLPDLSPTQIRQTMYNSAMDGWGGLSDKEKAQYNRMASPGETTGFFEYMQDKLADFRTYK